MWLQYLVGTDGAVAAAPSAHAATAPAAPFYYPLAIVFDFLNGDAAAAGAAFTAALSISRARELPQSPSTVHRPRTRGTPGHLAFNGRRGVAGSRMHSRDDGEHSGQSSVAAISNRIDDYRDDDGMSRDDRRDAALSDDSGSDETRSSDDDDGDITEIFATEGTSAMELDINLRAHALLMHDASMPLPIIEYPEDYGDDNMETPPETVPDSGANYANRKVRER